MNRRLYTVGRLDEESEGLIIVTNDGEFANRVAHPRYGVEKTYALKIHGFLDDDALEKVRRGVWLSEGRSPSMWVKVERRSKQFTNVIVRISEGRNRILRRVFAKVGHSVAKLKRVRIGEIGMTGVSRGGARLLKPEEVQGLLDSCRQNREPRSELRGDQAARSHSGGPGGRRGAPRGESRGRHSGGGAGRSSGGGGRGGRPQSGGRGRSGGGRSGGGGRGGGGRGRGR
jgi:23S rRNA pseudouridine2605 synthase